MLDADQRDDPGQGVQSIPPLSLSEAEEAVSRAEARAEEARARAAQLRRQANDGALEQLDPDGADETRDHDDGSRPSPARLTRWLSSRVRRPKPKTLGVAAAILLITASLVASGYLLRQHISLTNEHERAADFAAAARHGIEMMGSIESTHARENIQALIDSTTGDLQSQLRATSTLALDDALKAKVTTKATVQDVAVESMQGDSAVVLVVSKSDTTDPDKSKRPPVFWRISVNLTRVDGQLKMSRVDFIQ